VAIILAYEVKGLIIIRGVEAVVEGARAKGAKAMGLALVGLVYIPLI
jgi:hypothetical protein